MSTDALLFHGLPAVKAGAQWVLFSPYLRKSVAVASPQCLDDEFYRRLERQCPGFFSEPKLTVNDYTNSYNLVLSVTKSCNLRCRYCFVHGGDESTQMTEEEAARQIESAVSYCREKGRRTLTVSFFGGEPTLCVDLLRFAVSHARKAAAAAPGLQLGFSVTTNGVIPESTLQFLIEENFSVSVSMDGLPAAQNTLRPLAGGQGSAEQVEATLRRLIAAGVHPRLRVTITDVNVGDMAAIVEHVAAMGCRHVQFEVVTESGRAVEAAVRRPPVDQFVQHLRAAIARAGRLGVTVHNSAFFRLFTPSRHYCDGMGDARRIINADGSISTCVEVNSAGHRAAEYFILQTPTAPSASVVDPPSEINAECRQCFAKYICGGGCPSRNFHSTGSVHHADPYRCQTVKQILPELIVQAFEGCGGGEH